MEELKLGQAVISKQGKDAGHVYVVVGAAEGRVFLADARKFNVTRPKRKNPKHVQPTRIVIEEIRIQAEKGRDIDHGRFRRLLSEIRNGEAG